MKNKINTEYEVKFSNIKKNIIRKKLRKIGAEMIRSEYLQKRIVFHFPNEYKQKRSWVRIRDEGNKITMAFKAIVNYNEIEGQKEIELEVDNFKTAEDFLSAVGCRKKAYQENKRELWNINNVEIAIDEWPFLEPFIEIEGRSEKEVKEIAKKLGFDYSKKVLGSVAVLYREKYGVSIDQVSNQTPEIVFKGKNPFLKNA